MMACGETLHGGPEQLGPAFLHPTPTREAQGKGVGLGRRRGHRGLWGWRGVGGSPVGRAGHPRARSSRSQVPAMAHLRGGRTQLQTRGVGWGGGARETACQATGPAAPQVLHHEPPVRGPSHPGPLPPLSTNPIHSHRDRELRVPLPLWEPDATLPPL